MSSPTIITFTPMPYDEALAANSSAARHFLQLASELYQQALRMQQEGLTMGGPAAIDEPILPYAQAEARTHALLQAPPDSGMEATRFAHAYWQSLKHPWFDQVVRYDSQARAERERMARVETGRLQEVAEEASRKLAVHVEVDQFHLEAPHPAGLTLEAKVADALRQVLRAVDAEGLEAVRETVAQSVQLSPGERLVALDALRVRLEQETKERQRREALRLYEAKQLELAAERIAVRIEHCHKNLDGLESAAAASLERELATLEAAPVSLQVEERVQACERRIAEAARQQGLLEAAVAALRRQGYETVQVMQTLGPPEVRSAYLQDPRDEGRVALLQVAEERGLVSAEVVRRDSGNGSQQQKMQDREAQGRLCKAMEAVEKALAAKWSCSVQKRVEPGNAEVKANANVPSTTGGRRTRVAAALQTRALG